MSRHTSQTTTLNRWFSPPPSYFDCIYRKSLPQSVGLEPILTPYKLWGLAG